MEESTNQEAPKMSSVEEEELELSHTDKLVGVFSEPSKTFASMAKSGSKTSDWLIPITIVILVAILSNIIMMSNPTIRLTMIEKQMEQIEKQFDDAVAQGRMTEEQKQQQIDTIRERMDEGAMGVNLIFTIIGIVVFSFISLFVVTGVFYLFAKFVMKGDGSYRDALSAYGLPHYIIVIQVIVMVILALVMKKFFTSTSIAEFMETDKSTIAGFLLNKLDIFSIWYYSIIGIGFAKMFKSENTTKYLLMVFGIWIGFGLLMFALAQVVPFLKWFGF
jgi:hypothetical protein